MKGLRNLIRTASVCTLMISLISCSPTYKIKRLETKVNKMIEITSELLDVQPMPEPVLIHPANCPIILNEYRWIAEDLALKLSLIKKAQDNVLIK